MHKELRRLPSLDFLKGFEAAGRLLSFTRAAEELFVTQSALSRQIQALEAALGVDGGRRERPDPVGIRSRGGIINDHAEIGSAIHAKRGILHHDRAKDRMPKAFDSLAVNMNVVVAP